MMPLPAPSKGNTKRGIDLLRPFVNLRSLKNKDPSRDDPEFVLLVAWLVATLRDRGPYPQMVVLGEEGTAKTSLVKVVTRLTDPPKIEERRLPREDRDLFIAANNGHVMAFGNVSHLPDWLQNSLCTLSTGGGFATRALFTDEDEVLFNAKRPVILNGVKFAPKAELANRMIFFKLPPIPDKTRRLEEEFWPDFETKRPAILGALLDLVAYGLRELPNTVKDNYPRMADFAQWATACEGLAWDTGVFAKAYARNRRQATIDVIDDDPIADAIRSLVSEKVPEWEGTTKSLLDVLTRKVGERQANSKEWPSEPRALTDRLAKAQATLRRVGIEIVYQGNTNRGRRLIITYTPALTKAVNDTHDTHDRHSSLSSKPVDSDGRREVRGEGRAKREGREGREGRFPTLGGKGKTKRKHEEVRSSRKPKTWDEHQEDWEQTEKALDDQADISKRKRRF
jgi:hypothetical protein